MHGHAQRGNDGTAAAQGASDAIATAAVSSEAGRSRPGGVSKNFARLVKAALLGSTTAGGKPIEIWYRDEARVGRKGTHAYAVAVLDGAGRHQKSGEPSTPDNITRLSLPPYAPELNPMENVSEYLRGNKPCAVLWDAYAAIVEACRQA